MAKEIHARPGANAVVLSGVEALPDPGPDKVLVVFVSGSVVRLRMATATATIGEQETGSREGGSLPAG